MRVFLKLLCVCTLFGYDDTLVSFAFSYDLCAAAANLQCGCIAVAAHVLYCCCLAGSPPLLCRLESPEMLWCESSTTLLDLTAPCGQPSAPHRRSTGRPTDLASRRREVSGPASLPASPQAERGTWSYEKKVRRCTVWERRCGGATRGLDG